MNKNSLACCLLVLAIISGSCASVPRNNKLDPESKEFISKTRYIISKEEKETFLTLEPENRSKFIEEFWARRDPTPGSEVNEFKEDYFKRIEEANLLFREGTTEGWLQDRGRIYILFGPPSERITYPRGIDFYGKPTEIWYYGFFPIVFIDNNWTGNYTLDPLSAYQISEIAKAQKEVKGKGKDIQVGKAPFYFEIRFEPKNGPGELVIDIPYKAIWFKLKDENFVTILDIKLNVIDQKGEKVWEHQESFEVSVSREEGLKLIDEIYSLVFKVDLKPGEYTIEAEISNRTGGGTSKKSLKLSRSE